MTALRDKLRQRVQPFLEPGEEVQEVFLAQTGPVPYLQVLVGALVIFAIVKRRIIVVTDRAIVVVDAGKWTGTSARSVVARLPRQTRLGPLKGMWAKLELGDERMWVHKRFHKDVEAADLGLSSGGAPS